MALLIWLSASDQTMADDMKTWADGWKYAFSAEGRKAWEPEFTVRLYAGFVTEGPAVTAGVKIDDKRTMGLMVWQGKTYIDAAPADIYSVSAGLYMRRYFLIGDSDKLAALKNQKDGKLVDHIYMDKSLIGKKHSIYYIGDSKYYPDGTHPEGVALYKQFTYAKNAIQDNIDQFYLKNSQNSNDIRYRDKDTEGYNITPNFFVIPKVDGDTLDFTVPSFAPTDWRPKPNRHFKDRLFDRDTLLLREYSINMIFLIAAYGAYEDCWTDSLRETIRKDMVKLLNDTYKFFIIEPMDVPLYSQNGLVGTIPFLQYFRLLLEGKAFEKDTPDGERDYRDVRENIEGYVQGGSIEDNIELKA